MTVLNNYEYHVFLSYKRNGAVEDWVKMHFYPCLEKWLHEELPPTQQVKIFFDKKMKTGDRWRETINDALRSTRLLLPIFSSHYFSSTWCLAELDAIVKREQSLYGQHDLKNRGLIYPIIFSGEKYIPKEMGERIAVNMYDYTTCCPAFSESIAYIPFEREIKKISKDIAELLSQVPDFNPDWPINLPNKNNDDLIESVNLPRY